MPTPSAGDAEFLKGVDAYNQHYNALQLGERVEPLHHSFWSAEEIESAAAIQEEWDVPEALIPFYGDWHVLLCLDRTSGRVVYLDDERAVVWTWVSAGEFAAALRWIDEEDSPRDGGRIRQDGSWLDF